MLNETISSRHDFEGSNCDLWDEVGYAGNRPLFSAAVVEVLQD